MRRVRVDGIPHGKRRRAKRKSSDGKLIGKRVNNGGNHNPTGKTNPPKVKRTGRPKNSKNKASKKIREVAAASGELPHEFCLRLMRLGVGRQISRRRHTITWDDIKWAIRTSINYYAPKQSAIHLTGADDGPVKVLSLDPAALARCTPEQLAVLATLFGQLQDGGKTMELQALPDPTKSTADDYAKTLEG